MVDAATNPSALLNLGVAVEGNIQQVLQHRKKKTDSPVLTRIFPMVKKTKTGYFQQNKIQAILCIKTKSAKN